MAAEKHVNKKGSSDCYRRADRRADKGVFVRRTRKADRRIYSKYCKKNRIRGHQQTAKQGDRELFEVDIPGSVFLEDAASKLTGHCWKTLQTNGQGILRSRQTDRVLLEADTPGKLTEYC